MKNKIKDKVYKYVEKFLFENREIWNSFVFINENGVNKKISLMKLWDLIKTKKQYEDLEKLFWNEINKRTSPHMYLSRKQWNWMSSTMLFKQNRIV
ncbi:hypothetical protein [Spiroplasma ixodetis]|uniref:hypothetical protein n=1 Tax=Spiroplasma ixodetis TaxID=2141 RepID=UPI002579179C|nr:hypothetical protein [Spiroplasma ixodetis]